MELPSELRLLTPRTVAQAVTARLDFADSRFVAGGTDLITNLRRGIGATSTLIDLAAIEELRSIALDGGVLRIGAGVTLAALEASETIRHDAPVIAAAAASVGGPAHREAATVGGNLCLDTRCVFYNQSEWWRAGEGYCLKYKGDVCRVAPTGTRCHAAFSGDLAPALLVLEAEAEVAGAQGARRLPLSDIYNDDGAAHLRLRPEELLVRVRIPLRPGLVAGYRKARLRGSIDFPLAGAAVALSRTGAALTELRVALTGTNSRPIVINGTEALLGKPVGDSTLAALDKLIQKQVSPMRTTTMPAHYRRRVAAALACRLLKTLWEER